MRPLYLRIRPGGLFKNHTSLFVPSSNDVTVGRLFEAEGNPFEGFRHSVTRGFDISAEGTAKEESILLGEVDESCVADSADSEAAVQELGEEVTPIDDLERIIFSVPAPSKSLRPASAQRSEGDPPRGISQANCQTWLHQVLSRLMDEKMLEQGALCLLEARMQ